MISNVELLVAMCLLRVVSELNHFPHFGLRSGPGPTAARVQTAVAAKLN